MLNEEKIRLMTEISMLEKREGRQINLYHSYFKSDYIGSCLLRSFFKYTVCALLCLLIWGLYNLNNLLNTVSLAELVRQGQLLIGLYLGGLIVYLVITGLVASSRYEKAYNSMREYAFLLRRLESRYEARNKTREKKEGRRHDGAAGI